VTEYASTHRTLTLKHARAYVRANAEKIPAEDVAREIELMLTQLEKRKGLAPATVGQLDACLRSVVRYACGRAKRRRKLVEQVAAGDDLAAMADDLRALDDDLPDPPQLFEPEAVAAKEMVDAIKGKLAPHDALIFALLYEDDATPEEVARVLSVPAEVVEEARERISKTSVELGVRPVSDRRTSI
jgi:DNA-directed RNA polymerase specialized sigma24 family protein